MFTSLVHAEDAVTAKEFFYKYTEDVEMVLLPDNCDKQDVSRGWIAYAVELTTSKRADGCWVYGPHETVNITLTIRENEYADYVFYKSKFNPRY